MSIPRLSHGKLMRHVPLTVHPWSKGRIANRSMSPLKTGHILARYAKNISARLSSALLD
jgi:hypothetical protein